MMDQEAHGLLCLLALAMAYRTFANFSWPPSCGFFLQKRDLAMVSHSLITSRPSSCNVFRSMWGLPLKAAWKLQRVQNAVARLLTGPHYQEQIPPVLKEQHWLPVLL